MSKLICSLGALAVLTLWHPGSASAQTFIGNPNLNAQNRFLYRMYGSPNPDVIPSNSGPLLFMGNRTLVPRVQYYGNYGGNWGYGWNGNQRFYRGYNDFYYNNPGYNGFYYGGY